jgi:hypothetical protein
MSYRAPIPDMLFAMQHLAQLEQLATLPGLADANMDTAAAVLDECARFAQEVLAPINHSADQAPSRFEGGQVITSAGFQAAYQQLCAGGWQGLQQPAEFGGQGLPKTIGAACSEMLASANLSFSLVSLLTDGATEALLTAGSPELQQRYLPQLISGQWAGTMNLTEPQAGSDLALIRSRAEPQADGTYRIFGTKIFITYGEQDLSENIIHLVLARTPDAPAGIQGISLFVVPKFLPQEDGSLGARNDVHCVGIEHKLGIQASPTCTLQYGDHGGAVGYLVGEENRGLGYMFIMMNAARYSVGLQGIGLAERAYQHAVAFARERVQSRPVDGSSKAAVAIIAHPDVRRMLMTMRALTQGCRALAAFAAGQHDRARHSPDATERETAQTLYEFLVPLVKGYSTEMVLEVAQLGVQVHGGMGFIEETGAAQYLRDAKILAIYEGTTAIQANDLLGRKTLRDQGALARSVAAQVEQTVQHLQASGDVGAARIALQLQAAATAFTQSVDYMCSTATAAPNAAYAGSVPLLMLAGNALAGWQMAQSWLAAQRLPTEQAAFALQKKITCQFYAEHILPRCLAQAQAIAQGAGSCMALAPQDF